MLRNKLTRCTMMTRIALVLLMLGCVSVQHAIAADSFEPDNAFGQATPITPADLQVHDLSNESDVDFVKFTLANASMIFVETDSQGSISTDIRLFNSSWQEIGNSVDFLESLVPAGNYFVSIAHLSGDVTGITYELSLTVVSAVPDLYEDDDTPETANVLALGTSQPGHTLAPAADEDWYKFTLPATTSIVISVPSTLSDTGFDLFASGDLFNPIDSGSSRIVSELPADTYYVKVFSFNSLEVSSEYPIVVWNQNGPDPFEDDDTPATASFIGTQAPKQTHNFSDSTDADWTRFFAKAGDTCEIAFQEIGFDVEVFAELFANDGTQLLQDGDTSFVFVIPSDGFYHVRFTNTAPWTGGVDTVYTCGVPQQPAGLVPGTIVGVVSALAKGPALPDAQIEITDFGGLVTRSDTRGVYSFPGLPPGVYTLIATASGHVPSAPTPISLGSGAEELSFELEPTPGEDIDSDGGVDAVDVQLVINAALDQDIGGRDADVNNSGEVDAVDVQLVIIAALN